MDDSFVVLDGLVRSRIWSQSVSSDNFKRIVIDASSLATYLYRECLYRRLISKKSKPQADLFSDTIVDLNNFTKLTEKWLLSLISTGLEPLFVFQGRQFQAPPRGKFATQLAKARKIASDCRLVISKNQTKYSARQLTLFVDLPDKFLNKFKSILMALAEKRKKKIKLYQSAYSSFAPMTRLARDNKCPVLTDDSSFILMDVRAGFILMKDFFDRPAVRSSVISSISSTGSSKKSLISPKSKSRLASPASSTSATRNYVINYSKLFLQQHPGLTIPLASFLFSLLNSDLIEIYAEAFRRMRVYPDQYRPTDLLRRHTILQSDSRQEFQLYHQAAARLELAITFLRGKTRDIVMNAIHSEALRTKSSLHDDIINLMNYYTCQFSLIKPSVA